MKIKVDFDLCESNALCEALAPETSRSTTTTSCRSSTRTSTDENLDGQAGGRGLPASGDQPRRGLSVPADGPRPSTAGSRSSPVPAPASAAPRRSRWPAPAPRVVLNDLPGRGGRGRRGDPGRSAPRRASSRGDVGERATADAMLAAAVEGFGRLDIVVNNAGITRDRMLFNMTDEEWDHVIRVHLRGHFLLSRNAAAYWRAAVQGDRRAGLRPASSTPPPRRSSPARPARPTTPPPRPASPR